MGLNSGFKGLTYESNKLNCNYFVAASFSLKPEVITNTVLVYAVPVGHLFRCFQNIWAISGYKTTLDSCLPRLPEVSKRPILDRYVQSEYITADIFFIVYPEGQQFPYAKLNCIGRTGNEFL